MNPSIEWKYPTSKMFEEFNKSKDRFFECDCRFGKFRLRSALENMFLIRCHYEESVKTLEYESLRIPYIDKTGKSRVTIPDFVINDRYIVEIKSKNKHNDSDVILKFGGIIDFAHKLKHVYGVMISYEDFDDFFNRVDLYSNTNYNHIMNSMEKYNDEA